MAETAAAGESAPPSDTFVSPDPQWDLGERIAVDDFATDLGQWVVEQEPGGHVTAGAGVLNIDVPGGCTLWFRPVLSGPLLIRYDAQAVSEGGRNDRVSDLNCFWMARDSRNLADIFATPRSGRFAEYDYLRCYYVGLGANGNTTTRFRRYVGEPGNRPLRPEHDLAGADVLLQPNRWQTIQLVAAGERVAYYRDGRCLFDFADAQPHTSGWFALRTVSSHLRIRNFQVWQLRERRPPKPEPR